MHKADHQEPVIKKNESENSIPWVIIIVILFFLLSIAFIVSLGEFTFSKADIDAELRQKRDDLRVQHRLLNEVIKQKEAIRDKRLKWCKRVYVVVRVGVIMIGAGIIYLLIALGWIDATISEVTSVSGAMALLIIIFGFILKSSTSLQEIICSLKEIFENILYGRYRNIHKEIEDHYQEFQSLQTQIDKLDEKISD